MRRSVLLIALLLAPIASSHGEVDEVLAPGTYLNHVEAWTPYLSEGEQRLPMAFGGGPLQEGWLLVIHGVVENGSVQVGVWDDGGPVWSWDEGSHTETLRVDHTSFPEIWARPVAGNASLRLYYDQTCDCTGKGLPMASGPLWFNIDAAAGDEVSFWFKMQPGPIGFGKPDPYNGTFDVRMQLVEADRTGRSLSILQEAEVHYDATTDASCFQDGTWGVCTWFNFTAPADGRQAILMELSQDRPDWGIKVRPTVQVQEAATQQAPGPALPLVAILIGLAARRRR